MRNIAIYGAGGLGRETALLIRQLNQSSARNIVGFFDDAVTKGKLIDTHPVLGGIAEVNKIREPLDIVLAIADSQTRSSVAGKITNVNISFPTIIHPACLAGDAANQFGKGCILTAGVILTTGIRLGDFVIINLSTTVGHDVSIGDFASVMPGCNISGNVRIGSGTQVGTGARILQNLSVGSHCRVGAGAVLTTNFGDSKTIVGVPAREK